MASRLKWLIFIQLLLTDQTLSQATHSQMLTNKRQNKINHLEEDASNNPAKLNHIILRQRPILQSADNLVSTKQAKSQAALHLISQLSAKLQGQNQYVDIQGKVSCDELVTASTVDDSLSYELPQELLGLSLVPVLVVANCRKEAQTLVEKLYNLLGMSDTDQLLLDLETLMERKISKMAASSARRNKIEQNIDVVMFNIKQLAQDEDIGDSCQDWAKLNGTMLVGSVIEGPNGSLEEAVQQCEHMGALCAGVAHSKNQPGNYQAVLKKGSRILPSDAESWILQCQDLGSRFKRSQRQSCIDKNEQKVYKVMEWIPAVSTLYNLGTAVYYASVNCSETAKERAILSAVDLGTDALMVVTGGTAGVVGYAVGAGVKTGVKAGVKYMMKNQREEGDVMVNQFSWEDDSVVFQP